MIPSLQSMLAWLGLLVSATGVVVTALYLRRSRWTWLLLAGFIAETVVSLFYRVAPAILRYDGMQPFYLLMSLVGLAGRAAIVAGVAAVLLERREAPPATPPPFIRA